MKRGILSALHSFFDPHGFTTPFLLRGKLVNQQCLAASSDLGWDAQLPCKIVGKWNYFLRRLKNLCKLELTRWFTNLTKESNVTLHVFCDASKDAYGAVAYITIQPGNYVSFVMAKSCVVPCSTALWSIPQKEMITVVDGARVAVITIKALSLGLYEFHMWTD